MELTNNAIAELRELVNIAYDTIAEKGGEVPEERSLVNLPDAIGSIELSTPDVEEKEVNFYDYKGNCIYSYTATEAMNLKELPPGPPDDEWVTFHSWSETLEAINRGLPLSVGAYYDVIDELKEGGWHAILQVRTYNGKITFNQNINQIDWGDGTIDSEISHDYGKPGIYTIKMFVGKRNGYSHRIYPLNTSDLTYSVLRIHMTSNTDFYIGCKSGGLIFGNLMYYTTCNSAAYEITYQAPATMLKNIVFSNIYKSHYPNSTSSALILPSGSDGNFHNGDLANYITGCNTYPYGIQNLNLANAAGRVVPVPTTCIGLNLNRTGTKASVAIYSPIPPSLYSSSASSIYIPIGSLKDYQNATNYGLATFIECIPTEINSFSITADDVPADATTTTIHIKASLSMKAWYDDTMVHRDLERDVTSDAFEANTSSKPREIEISFSMLGETRTCTIILHSNLAFDEAESLSEDAVNYISTTYGSDVMTALESYIETSNNPNRIRWAVNTDPDIVCSLVETSKTRWLVNEADGNYIVTPFLPDLGITYGATVIQHSAIASKEYSVFGSRTTQTSSFLLQIMDGKWRSQCFGGWKTYGTVTLNVAYNVEFNFQGIKVDGTSIVSGDYNPSSTITDSIWLVVNNNADAPHGAYFIGGYAEFYRKNENGEITNRLVPFKRNGEMELLDILTGTFATRVGTFTEQFTDKE